MCKTLEPSDFPRVFPSTEICRGVGDFSTGASKGVFSTGKFSFSTVWCGNKSAFGVDVGLDLLDPLGEGGVLLHLLFHLLDGIQNRGVVPVVKDLADVIQT